MTREELIAALEKAEGPSRELDEAIARTCGWKTKESQHFGTMWQAPTSDGWYRDSDTPPWFTDSIDAALMLVPKGLVMSLSNRVPGDDEAIVYGGNVYERGNAPTLPLALCIAALKARGEP